MKRKLTKQDRESIRRLCILASAADRITIRGRRSIATFARHTAAQLKIKIQ